MVRCCPRTNDPIAIGTSTVLTNFGKRQRDISIAIVCCGWRASGQRVRTANADVERHCSQLWTDFVGDTHYLRGCSDVATVIRCGKETDDIVGTGALTRTSVLGFGDLNAIVTVVCCPSSFIRKTSSTGNRSIGRDIGERRGQVVDDFNDLTGRG